MDKAKNIAKSGWHPQGKNGGKESWRGDNKGINQVAGWLGKGKDTHTAAAKEHTSRPLSSLKDPDTFGPPPKNVNYHGGVAVPNTTTPGRRGLGAPVGVEEVVEQQQKEQTQQKPTPPPVPYRANNPGLNTKNLPRLREDSPLQTSSPSTKPKPSLPPRLPPRQNSHPTHNTPEPPPDYTTASQQPSPSTEFINQDALSRLGKAGVSVPGPSIGSFSESLFPTDNSRSPNPWHDQPTSAQPTTSSPTGTQSPSLSNLGSRFSKLSTVSSPPTASSQGTSIQQKQDALRTANMFRNDPSSVSLSDARGAASTANNFRERHGEQVAAGGRWAGAMNKKYDVANRVNGYTGGSGTEDAARPGQAELTKAPTQDTTASPWANEPSQGGDEAMSAVAELLKRAPPPPPAARRTGPGPPPVPLGSKPRS